MRRRYFIVSTAGWFAVAKADNTVTLPFQEIDKTIVVDARIDGSGPYEFLVDTGAISGIITSGLATKLHLAQIGNVTLSRGDQFPMVRVPKVEFAGGLTVRNLAYLALPGGSDQIFGTLGAGLLTRNPARVDFERGLIEFPAAGRFDHTGYTALHSHFMWEQPPYETRFATDISIDGMTFPALWDTGNGATLQISDAVGRQLGLWSDTVPYAPKRVGHVGGPDKNLSRVVRAGRVKVGPYTFDRPLVLLRWQAVNQAVLGLSLIRTMNFDVDPVGTIWVKRNRLRAESIGYSKSGIWFDQNGQDIQVVDVGFGSPAAAAGVRSGDVLADAPTIEAAAAMIGGPAGRMVSLRLRRNGAAVQANFHLADYL
jgi:Aspartyl protease